MSSVEAACYDNIVWCMNWGIPTLCEGAKCDAAEGVGWPLSTHEEERPGTTTAERDSGSQICSTKRRGERRGKSKERAGFRKCFVLATAPPSIGCGIAWRTFTPAWLIQIYV